jgi:hypothetical protein
VSEDAVRQSVEEAGETTAADSVPTPVDTRPVGEGTTADVEGEDQPERVERGGAERLP